MLSLKSLIPATLLALSLPVAAPAHTFSSVFPLFSSVMAPRTPSVMLHRAEYIRTPILRPSIGIAPSMPHLRIMLRCAVAGTPVEFPDDLHIWSNAAVAAGTVATWSVTGSSFSGTVVLPALAPGQFYFASHVLPGGWPAGSACSASAH